MRTLLPVNILLISFTLLIANAAAQERYVEGTHYEKLPQAIEPLTDKPYDVVEVFWYGCPHCFKFEPQVQQHASMHQTQW